MALSSRKRLWSHIAMWWSAALVVAACNSPRDPVSVACTGNQHCPADGKWYCDVTTKQCVPCAGACPVKRIPDKDTGVQDDGDATVVDGAATDVATSDGEVADATTDANVSPTDTALGCDVVLPVIKGTCVGHCFQFDLDEPGSIVHGDNDIECSCHPWCKLNIAGVPPCCSDYEQACGCLDTGNVSCSGRCGSRDANKSCQCDDGCEDKDDCCDDRGSVCGKCVGGKKADGSCADYDPNYSCQCDSQCLGNMDCCSDFKTLGCPES